MPGVSLTTQAGCCNLIVLDKRRGGARSPLILHQTMDAAIGVVDLNLSRGNEYIDSCTHSDTQVFSVDDAWQSSSQVALAAAL